MIKKIFYLVLVLAVALPAVQAIGVGDLDVSCSAPGLECVLVKDSVSGLCRTVSYLLDGQALNLLACDKGENLEVYRQVFPAGKIFTACVGAACVDRLRGFGSVPLVSASEIEPEPVESPREESQVPETIEPVLIKTSGDYPLSPNEDCGNGKSCAAVIEEWNDATWDDTVDDNFATNQEIAAVRWYNTEGSCTGEKCQDQLHQGNKQFERNVAAHKFYGVTDEFSNVLLNHAMGGDLGKYEELHRFAEMLRHPNSNNLQCWMYYVGGQKSYSSYQDVCVASDSASDASVRILGAYAIACAKQQAGIWKSDIDFCADYVEQGNAIFGIGTKSHGEVIKLENGRYFLANGYNNAGNAPTAAQSIRPDYYELQFLMDFAAYKQDSNLKKAVLDIAESYQASLGSNGIHRGKTGKFNSDGITGYQCTDLCGPEYMDNIDTWRAIPALSGLYVSYGDVLPQNLKSMYVNWWNKFGGGAYGPSAAKPFEIYSNSGNGVVKQSELSYKTLSMWIPLGVRFNKDYTRASVRELVMKYDWNARQFSGAGYFGAYFSQFAQRAIGSATGMISPAFWANSNFRLPEGSVESDNDSSGEVVLPPVQNLSTLPEESSDESGVADLGLSCSVRGMNCNIRSDKSDGACRTVDYDTTFGPFSVKVCEKGETNYEVYLLKAPNAAPYKACFESGCVSDASGFTRFSFSGQSSSGSSDGGSSDSPSEDSSSEDLVDEAESQPSGNKLASLSLSCNAEGSSCDVKYDKTEGECRTVLFGTSNGEIKTLTCVKDGNRIEMYRQAYPSNLKFKACVSGACIDEISGFGKTGY